jgi:hypothetical protein
MGCVDGPRHEPCPGYLSTLSEITRLEKELIKLEIKRDEYVSNAAALTDDIDNIKASILQLRG